jgi:zinc transport system substrate-binding protein
MKKMPVLYSPIFVILTFVFMTTVILPKFVSDSLASSANETTGLISTNMNIPRLKIVVSFYPLLDFTKEIGGNRVEVSSLIPIGIEPHDFDPTIRQIQNAETADLLIYNGAGLEKWIDKINMKSKIDASQNLSLLNSNDAGTNNVYDPHVWLDPILAKGQVQNIRNALIRADPMNTKYYSENANKLIEKLDKLDRDIRSDLSDCKKHDFISFHNSFSYFAKRYGLNQYNVYGLSPEGEILPQRLQQIIQLARDKDLNVIYSENLIDPRFANLLAQEIPNGKVLVLSPIEGINRLEQNNGIDYIDKMYENIKNLQVGLECPLN